MQQKLSLKFQLEQSQPISFPGGTLHRAVKDNFSSLQGFAVQSLRLDVNGIREPHLHPNAAQLDYCISGNARVGILGPDGQLEVFELEQGSLSFIPQGYIHWIENIGQGPLHFLLVLSNEKPQTIEVPDIVAAVPHRP